jgi:lantibiotic modifying enzyme
VIAFADVSAALALDVAAALGFGIARRALWSGDRCTWFDGVPVGPEQSQSTSANVGCDVYGGSAGIGLFLAQLVARADDPTLRRTARGALRQALASAAAPNAAPLGFYAGTAGAAAAVVLGGLALGDDELVERGGAMLRSAALTSDDAHASDLIGGTAGTLVALVVAASALGDDELLERAHEAGRALIALAHRNADGSLSWTTMTDQLADLTGFAHGSAGNAHALLALHAIAPDPAYAAAVNGALAYERGTFSAAYANWPDYRWFGTGPKEPGYSAAWCHGAVGIARNRLLAESLGFDAGAGADVALRTTAAQAERFLADPSSDTTLCHGLFGAVDALIDGVRAGRTEHALLIARCASAAAERHHFGELPWPSGLLSREPVDGLMMGHAGVGHVYLRLADPALPSLLAPGTPPPGAQR